MLRSFCESRQPLQTCTQVLCDTNRRPSAPLVRAQGKKARTLLSGKGARWLKVLALLASAGVLAGSVYGIVQVGTAGGGTSGVESCFPALQADCEPSRLVPTTVSPAG